MYVFITLVKPLFAAVTLTRCPWYTNMT